jgi:tetratricopeptide (TPR) repeat protein
MKRQLSLVLLGIALVAFTGCGKNNIFSWAHSAGSNSDSQALSSDAYSALQNKDFAKALEYYSKILESDPNNSEAIYGYSAAKLADSGIDIASLIANFVRQSNSAPYNHLAPSIASAANTTVSPSSLLPQNIITNRVAILRAVNDVLSSKHLAKIIKGMADGKIDPDNTDVNLNIAFCLVLRAAINAYDSGAITFSDDYTVTAVNPNVAAADEIGRDLASAYQRFLKVAVKLKLSSSSGINSIKEDINKLFNQLVAKTGTTVDINHDYILD